MEQRRRRIDRVTADDFLDGVEDKGPGELRAMRDDCREEEARLSYTRRLLQARLDIVRAELARRRGEDEGHSLVEELPDILADPNSTRRDQPHARLSPVYAPSGDERRSEDRLTDDTAVGEVLDLDDEALASLAERLDGEEQTVSALRRTVLHALDRLQEELVARYRDHGHLDEIVAAAVPPTPPSPR
jgi:hypothetical protein